MNVLRRTVATLVLDGSTAVMHEGVGDLPNFNPDDDFDPLPEAVVTLHTRLGAASAV